MGFFYMLSLGQVVRYSVFMALPLPKTLVKTLAKNLANKSDQNFGHKSEANLITGGEGYDFFKNQDHFAEGSDKKSKPT